MQVPALLTLLTLLAVGPQDLAPTPPANGPRHLDPAWHRLVGATVHFGQDFGRDKVLESATIVVRDGRFLYFGASPEGARGWQRIGAAGAREWDLAGRHVYPGFIEPWAEVDAAPAHEGAEVRHWNPMITPERTALDGPGLSKKERAALRGLGFTAAALAPKEGILRGRAALVSLAEPRDASVPGPAVHAADVFHAASLDRRRGRDPMGTYPGSQMGAIALLRQTLFDAEHRARGRNGDVPVHALDHLGGAEESLPLGFDVADELEILRAAKVLKEAGRQGFALGSGTEFRRLEALAAANLAGLLVPLSFPEEPDVDSVGTADAVALRTLMTWEQAPTNPRRVVAAGIRASLTSARLKKKKDFWKNLRKAVEHGLSEADALAMLTLRPAQLLGVEDRLGRIAPGYVADLVVTDKPIFEKGAKILEVWVEGRRHVVNEPEDTRLDGTWTASVAGAAFDLVVDGKKLTVKAGDEKSKAKSVRFAKDALSFVFDHEPFGDAGTFSLQGIFDGERLEGVGRRADGTAFRWSAERAPDAVAEADADEDDDGGDDDDGEEKDAEDESAVATVPESIGLPFGAYALDAPPAPVPFLEVKNATVWTCGPDGIIEGGTIVVENGRLTHVGGAFDGPRPEGAVTLDAGGKHVTPGLIDCHSHTGISRGVNEAGQAVTAEVRIADVTNPDDVNWYRQLAGGLTAANQLHGSANPIGGQNQVVKLRWGAIHPDDLHFAGAKPGIKFALGENVKHSNRSRTYNVRYPQTRMGVETLMRDRFNAARDYAAELESWSAGGSDASQAPARDLELDALAEILAGERWIHCHSYRQDEILMLCRLAQDYGFRIGTFQHILEGYKVAEAIREVAVGTSAFSDWWGYKFEVQDAIPYAGAIMHDVGIVVSFNSDSSELARRMNLEAAKAVKYGGLEPHEALKFVTLNPAIQLGVDDRVGSLEVGKDADFVIWSGDPLSNYSICESTWIDGAEYFSLERDRELRERNAAERRRIVQKLLKPSAVAKGKGGKDGKADGDEPGFARGTDEVVDEAFVQRRERFLELLRAGKDPEAPACGDCGMAALEDHAH